MVKLFGVNIAKEIAKAMGGGMPKISLIKVTPGERTSGSLSDGNNPTTKTYTGRGIVDDYEDSAYANTEIERGDRRLLILGATLPAGIFPENGDRAIAEGTTLNIIKVKRDPAAATYTCQVRGK